MYVCLVNFFCLNPSFLMCAWWKKIHNSFIIHKSLCQCKNVNIILKWHLCYEMLIMQSSLLDICTLHQIQCAYNLLPDVQLLSLNSSISHSPSGKLLFAPIPLTSLIQTLSWYPMPGASHTRASHLQTEWRYFKRAGVGLKLLLLQAGHTIKVNLVREYDSSVCLGVRQ